MPRRHSRWSRKRFVAVSSIMLCLSGFAGSSLGTLISRRTPPPTQISRVMVINNYPDHTESVDLNAELELIVKQLASKQIRFETAVSEIRRIVPRAIASTFIEDIKPILIGIIGATKGEDIQKAVEAIAEALVKASEPLPTPIPDSTIVVRPSP